MYYNILHSLLYYIWNKYFLSWWILQLYILLFYQFINLICIELHWIVTSTSKKIKTGTIVTLYFVLFPNIDIYFLVQI